MFISSCSNILNIEKKFFNRNIQFENFTSKVHTSNQKVRKGDQVLKFLGHIKKESKNKYANESTYSALHPSGQVLSRVLLREAAVHQKYGAPVILMPHTSPHSLVKSSRQKYWLFYGRSNRIDIVV